MIRVIQRLVNRMRSRLLLLAALAVAPALTLAAIVGIEQRRPGAEHSLAEAVLLVLVAGLGIAIAWVSIDLLVRRKARALAQTMRRLADGDLTARTDLGRSSGELGELANALDALASRLEQNQAATAAHQERESQFQDESRRLLALHQASTALAAQSGTPDAILQEILKNAVSLVGADSGSLYRWDAEAGLLHCVRNWNVPAADSTPDMTPDQGLVGKTFSGLETVVVNQYQTWEHAMPTSLEAGLRTRRSACRSATPAAPSACS